jgi:uncharacterized protein (DUF736 family)
MGQPHKLKKGEKTMIIGKFTKSGDEYSGIIDTLMVTAKIKIVPVREKKENSPDYTVSTEDGKLVGFGRVRTSANKNKYMRINLEDPFVPATVWCALLKRDDGSYSLNWNRPFPQAEESDASDAGEDF